MQAVHAENLAKQSSAELLILHIEEPPLAYGGGELYYDFLSQVLNEYSKCSVRYAHLILNSVLNIASS